MLEEIHVSYIKPCNYWKLVQIYFQGKLACLISSLVTSGVVKVSSYNMDPILYRKFVFSTRKKCFSNKSCALAQ